jgi:hypothetical protein
MVPSPALASRRLAASVVRILVHANFPVFVAAKQTALGGERFAPREIHAAHVTPNHVFRELAFLGLPRAGTGVLAPTLEE